ncbi:MAG: hypothetical protein LRY73_05115 [Bacillus sp. (in: Bacteria)]|nr:hypothetical protein [Bacillus sp. (in: firmicutes)]
MDPRSINNWEQYGRVQTLKKEIHSLEKSLAELKGVLLVIQQNCRHDFKEGSMVRRCQKCDYVESMYY